MKEAPEDESDPEGEVEPARSGELAGDKKELGEGDGVGVCGSCGVEARLPALEDGAEGIWRNANRLTESEILLRSCKSLTLTLVSLFIQGAIDHSTRKGKHLSSMDTRHVIRRRKRTECLLNPNKESQNNYRK
jgi:hypothetical protein